MEITQEKENIGQKKDILKDQNSESRRRAQNPKLLTRKEKRSSEKRTQTVFPGGV